MLKVQYLEPWKALSTVEKLGMLLVVWLVLSKVELKESLLVEC